MNDTPKPDKDSKCQALQVNDASYADMIVPEIEFQMVTEQILN